MAVQEMFGDKVISKGGEATTASFGGEGKVLGIYFSALWCPPCRAFTPQLAAFYETVKKGDKKSKFDIIFVSSDRDQASFDEYLEGMPWHALPFDDRKRKAELSRKYKVKGIPTLVFIDAETGKIITTDGRRIVAEDPTGEDFPWKPKPPKKMLGEKFLRRDGDVMKEVGQEAFDDCVLGLYFSAQWCPPCRGFTPKLVDTYNRLRKEGKKFEIILCSSDHDKESFRSYFESMPWLALPHGDKRKGDLGSAFHVSGIPKLVLLDQNLRVITEDGRGAIASDPTGKEFPWIPKPVNVLADRFGRYLNEEVCVLYFPENEGAVAEGEALLRPLGEKEIAEVEIYDRLQFFVCTPTEDITESVCSFLKIPSERPFLAILNCPEQVQYHCEAEKLDEQAVTSFVADFKADKLKAIKL